MAETINYVRPQPGFQEDFLSSSADIVIGGSAAGVGKTYALLLEYLRHKDVPNFGGVLFRRTSPQIRLEGGLWDTSMKMYPYVGGSPRDSKLEWSFKNHKNEEVSKLKFSHLEYEKNIFDWQGSQIPFIGFDELTHFSEKMFFYLLSRNRSNCGIKPYIRATCNPDPDSWVASFISWWIDQNTGFPIPERNGVIRYFIKYKDGYIWGSTYQEVIDKAWFFLEELVTKSDTKPENLIKSLTFISGSIYDNKELLKVNPEYLANLLSQDEATRLSLMDGNWKHVLSANDIFNFKAFNGMFNNKFEVKTGRKYLTADIAGQGSNKFVVGVFDGKELIDILVMEKSNGPEVINGINKMLLKHRIPNHRFIFDNDGIGQLVDGFFEGAIPFNGNGSVAYVIDQMTGNPIKENYFNIKNQLIFRCGKAVNDNQYKISESVANAMFDSKMTIKERALFERKAFKKAKPDNEQKIRAIPKEQMKAILQNESPDFMDMLCLREWFDLFDDNDDVGAEEYNN